MGKTYKKDKTFYQIGKNKYTVRWTHDGLFGDILDLEFYKNGKKINIDTHEVIGKTHAGASYNQFISVDDFAMLMEMEVDEIDTENGIIYLETK